MSAPVVGERFWSMMKSPVDWSAPSITADICDVQPAWHHGGSAGDFDRSQFSTFS